MPIIVRLIAGLVVLIGLASIHRARSLAGVTASRGRMHCPTGTICDRTLGSAVTPPSSWRVLPPGKLPPHTIGFYAPPVTGLSYSIRLIISSDGTTHERNNVLAATRAARAMTRGYTHMRPPLVRTQVRYGGAPGVMILNLPGQPQLLVAIVLAHAGALYRIISPGQSSLAADQRRGLAGFRFIPRVGRFPPANPPTPGSHR